MRRSSAAPLQPFDKLSLGKLTKSSTNVYNYISGAYCIASVIGSMVGSQLLQDHVYLLNGLGVLCFLLAAGLSCLVPASYGRNRPSDLPVESTSLLSDDKAFSSTNSDSFHSKQSVTQLLLSSVGSSCTSLLKLFSVPQPTRTILLIMLLSNLATRIDVLLPQYASLTLSWPLATVNEVLALKSLVSALVLFALPSVRRIFLEPHFKKDPSSIDLLIPTISLLLNALGIFTLALPLPSSSTLLALSFIVSLCVYTSGIGVADSLTTYGIHTLPSTTSTSASEITVTDFYTRTGLLATISALLGAPLWSALFSVMVGKGGAMMGVPFLVAGALFLCAMAGVGVLWRKAAFVYV